MTIQKKVCMLGAFAVGKTSLVARYVRGVFSDKYLTTVGVKIDRKDLRVGAQDLTLLLWDLHGDDEYQPLRPSHLRGSAGYLLVADGTRRDTLDQALLLQRRVEAELGSVPWLLVLNKLDLASEWEIDERRRAELGPGVVLTSARTGQGVEEAFQWLGARVLEGSS